MVTLGHCGTLPASLRPLLIKEFKVPSDQATKCVNKLARHAVHYVDKLYANRQAWEATQGMYAGPGGNKFQISKNSRRTPATDHSTQPPNAKAGNGHPKQLKRKRSKDQNRQSKIRMGGVGGGAGSGGGAAAASISRAAAAWNGAQQPTALGHTTTRANRMAPGPRGRDRLKRSRMRLTDLPSGVYWDPG